ncbi:MAG: hypothetical protein V7742_18015 [Halioglobus sp.]
MKKLINLIPALLTFMVSQASADDIEIYFNGGGATSAPYVHFLLDWRPPVFAGLCVFGPGGTCLASDPNDPSAVCPANSTCMSQDILDNLADPNDGIGIADGDTVNLFEAFVAILITIFEDPRVTNSPLKVALMSSNYQDSEKWSNPGPRDLKTGGGMILQGYKSVSDTLERQSLIDTLLAIPRNPSSSDAHALQVKESYFEWYRYISGGQWEHGPAGFDDNYGGAAGAGAPLHDPNTLQAVFDPTRNQAPGNLGGSNDLYESPFEAGECPRLFSVAMMMNSVQSDNNMLDNMNTEFGQSWGNSLKIETLWDYMHASDTNLTGDPNNPARLEKSWVISEQNPGGGWLGGESADAARAGGSGSPLDLSKPDELFEQLLISFLEILSVSSTFVSASVPVNVFNQTRTLDELFVGLFEAQGTVDWPGNIKKFRLVDDPNDADNAFDSIVDAAGQPGFATTGSNKGRISFNANTFWTDTSTLPLASVLDPNGSPPDNPQYVPDGVDGRVVDRGGAGQKIPGVRQTLTPTVGDNNSTGDRTVYVEDPNSVDGLIDFSTALATDTDIQSAFGVSDPTEAQLLIRWARGQDLNDDDSDGDTTDARFWALGDSIHSRPFALNYGATGGDYDVDNPDVKLLFGSGNGSFHILENTGTSKDDHTGTEVFAYYPLELLPQVKARSEGIAVSAGTEMRYGVDGPPVVLTNDANNDGSLVSGTDEAYVFFGLRRGGYSYHGLDIIDADNPELIWKISETRSDGSTTDFEELGLTFSTPKVTKVSYDGTSVDALIFAGGYYGGTDPNNPPSQFGKDVNASADQWGNAIYVVNARTGALIWKAVGGSGTATATSYQHPDMDHSMPSDITVLETNSGFAHRVYVGDTGGNVWRADIPPGACAVAGICANDSDDWRQHNWFVSRLASLPTGGDDIRFFHAPDVVESKLEDGTFFDGVMITSGNRADPLDARFPADTNYLYYMRDFRIASGDASSVIPISGGSEVPYYTSADLADRTTCTGSNDGATGCVALDPNAVAPAGWKIAMENATGEKGLATPLVDAGRVFATSYIPGSVGICGAFAEGNGRLYVVNLTDGAPVGSQQSYTLGPGIPSSPVLVGDAIWLPGGGIDEDLNGDGRRDGPLTPSLTQRLIPIYWREPGIDDL